ncbi:hypothetical protein GUITHDRAFT_105503 [Guillardia theta CCMP2712]|uniref:PDZ domain-containing protein n=1 Tax=Guillardia theta (strain CCMP2712) TaxID=905079 RepID=L1JL74_GUITC|nr:hypothetical protein GUITHDRAFT_105503 [Guillardia theta CCMP2712]EKX48879.1 hypothetical protein GUITHDRAFT_105503 [Guillardia theta CCMP2712]|eukprot:XP_005835859.1 hypothetical protein GUITHDRAFT_105503 [Guillardia theta CCMP2712]
MASVDAAGGYGVTEGSFFSLRKEAKELEKEVAQLLTLSPDCSNAHVSFEQTSIAPEVAAEEAPEEAAEEAAEEASDWKVCEETSREREVTCERDAPFHFFGNDGGICSTTLDDDAIGSARGSQHLRVNFQPLSVEQLKSHPPDDSATNSPRSPRANRQCLTPEGWIKALDAGCWSAQCLPFASQTSPLVSQQELLTSSSSSAEPSPRRIQAPRPYIGRQANSHRLKEEGREGKDKAREDKGEQEQAKEVPHESAGIFASAKKFLMMSAVDGQQRQEALELLESFSGALDLGEGWGSDALRNFGIGQASAAAGGAIELRRARESLTAIDYSWNQPGSCPSRPNTRGGLTLEAREKKKVKTARKGEVLATPKPSTSAKRLEGSSSSPAILARSRRIAEQMEREGRRRGNVEDRLMDAGKQRSDKIEKLARAQQDRNETRERKSARKEKTNSARLYETAKLREERIQALQREVTLKLLVFSNLLVTSSLHRLGFRKEKNWRLDDLPPLPPLLLLEEDSETKNDKLLAAGDPKGPQDCSTPLDTSETSSPARELLSVMNRSYDSELEKTYSSLREDLQSKQQGSDEVTESIRMSDKLQQASLKTGTPCSPEVDLYEEEAVARGRIEKEGLERPGGIGIQLTRTSDGTFVIESLPAGVAAQSGKVLLGDELTAVDGNRIIGRDMQFAASLIKVNEEGEREELTGTKGRAGHVVKLSLTRRIKGATGREKRVKLLVPLVRAPLVDQEAPSSSPTSSQELRVPRLSVEQTQVEQEEPVRIKFKSPRNHEPFLLPAPRHDPLARSLTVEHGERFSSPDKLAALELLRKKGPGGAAAYVGLQHEDVEGLREMREQFSSSLSSSIPAARRGQMSEEIEYQV